MNCFMGYNPLVAKEVKITTWIKEFDGDSPVYPSFPNDGDCFVVFATDEDALSHNALSKKTYTNGDWADAESGGGGGGEMDMPTFTVTVGEGGTATATCDKTYNECKELCDGNDYTYTYPCIVAFEGDGNEGSEYCTMYYFSDEASIYAPANANYGCSVTYNSDGTLDATILH